MNSQSSVSVDDVLAIAIAHHQARRLDEAAQGYRDILAQRPYHALANHNLGIIAWQQDRAADGLPYLRQAWSVNPDEGQFWLSYAEGLLRAQQPDEAHELLVTAQSRGLDSPELHALLERCAGELAALAATRPSADETQAVARLFSAGDHAGAEVAVRQLIDRFPASGMLWGMLGTILQVQGKQALAVLEEAARLAPDDAENLVGLGNAQQEAQQFDAAIATYRRALALAPDMPQAYCNLGSAQIACGALEAAAESFGHAVRLNRDYLLAHFNLGNCLVALGRFDAAVVAYSRSQELDPHNSDILAMLAEAHAASGNLADAVVHYRSALGYADRDANLHCNLGNALFELGLTQEATDCYRRATELDARQWHAWNGLGISLLKAGQAEQALTALQAGLAINPDDLSLQRNAGLALHSLQRHEEAAALYRRLLASQAPDAETVLMLGQCLWAQDDASAAAAMFEQARALAPDNTQAVLCHGHTQRALDDMAAAVASYRHAEELAGDNVPVLTDIAGAFHEIHERADAKRLYLRVLELEPDHAVAHCNLAVELEAEGLLEEAHAHYLAAINHDPTFVGAHNNLGICLRRMGKLEDAMVKYCHALSLQHDFRPAHLSKIAQLSEEGRTHDAIASCRAALEIFPGDQDVSISLLFLLSHAVGITPEELSAEHFRYGAACAALAGPLLPHENDRDPDRVIRLGFVSGDLYNHAVAHFIRPVVEYLRLSSGVKLFAYYNGDQEDHTTFALKNCFDTWRSVAGLDDDAFVSTIRTDAIDVLIDLSGHTSRNRLPAFARKPAPVQATWIGYPGTTGLTAMDYVLHDRHTLLPSMADQFTERFAYLPACAPFLPIGALPDVNPLPARTNGYITYGSFNRINKLSRPVIALWSALLRAQPTARLLLGAMPVDGGYRHLIDWFAEEGIDRSRLDFRARASMRAYLHLHHEVDLCLDPFPYTGGTTTLYCLWMGVPLLTLAGPTLAGRSSAGALSQLNLTAFVADSADMFVERGVAVSARLDLLADLRLNLRELLRNAPFSKPRTVAAGLEGAVRTMWQRWCAGLPPETFEADPELFLIDTAVDGSHETSEKN